MKRKVTILFFTALFLVAGSVAAYGQTREEEEKKKQEQIMQEKIQMEKRKALEERERVKVREDVLEEALEKSREAYARAWTTPDQVFVTTGKGNNIDNVYFMGGSQSSSSLQFSKVIKEGSFTKELSFEIDEDAKRASINVNGICEEGEILIVITMPSGSKYTEVLIDEYGSVNWTKSFSIDEENGSKTGEWRFKVTANNATGNFRLSLKSY